MNHELSPRPSPVASLNYPPRTTWIEVSRGALTHNLHLLRGRLAPSTQLMAVVKANAYGHGAAETARILQTAGADRFAVATLSEAVELRQDIDLHERQCPRLRRGHRPSEGLGAMQRQAGAELRNQEGRPQH